MEQAIVNIKAELEERVKFFKSEDKLIEAQRIAERTNFDIEMMQETDFVRVLRIIPDILRDFRQECRRIH